MRRQAKQVSASRIRHSLTFSELLVRLFVGAVCLSGIGVVSLRFYDALRLRMKQRALVASVENRGTDKLDAEIREAATEHAFEPSKVLSEASGSTVDKSITAVDAAPRTDASVIDTPQQGEKGSSGSSEREAEDSAGGEVTVSALEQEPLLGPDMGASESVLMGTSQSGGAEGSLLSPDNESIAGKFVLPEFELTDLTAGRSYDPIETHKGKVIILDFWASWCAPCLEEMKLLQSTFGEYNAEQFQLIAVNTEESKAIVEKAVENYQITSQVALDLEGSAASIFGVEALPTLVLIDQAGTVQRIHVGLEQGLGETIQAEVDRLLSGQDLPVSEGLVSRLVLANVKVSHGESIVLNKPAESLPSHEALSDIVLANGQVYSVGDHLAEAEKRFDRFFAESSERSEKGRTSLTNEETGLPTLVFSRRGEQLHGPLMSFHENGKRQSFIHYSFGKRIATLVSWDPTGRPLVMEEYRNGRKDGVRAIFKSCGGDCTTAHLWVAEEWRQGKLLATHVGLGGSEVVRNEIHSNATVSMTSAGEVEYRLASQQFSDYDQRLKADEDKLKQAVSDHCKQLKRDFRAQANARLIASSARTHSFTSMLNSGSGRSSALSGQRSMFSGPSMMMRNCGRS